MRFKRGLSRGFSKWGNLLGGEVRGCVLHRWKIGSRYQIFPEKWEVWRMKILKICILKSWNFTSKLTIFSFPVRLCSKTRCLDYMGRFRYGPIQPRHFFNSQIMQLQHFLGLYLPFGPLFLQIKILGPLFLLILQPPLDYAVLHQLYEFAGNLKWNVIMYAYVMVSLTLVSNNLDCHHFLSVIPMG